MSKMADRLILRPISEDAPGSASTGGTPRQKMSKAVAPRDAKVFFVREIEDSVQFFSIRRAGMVSTP